MKSPSRLCTFRGEGSTAKSALGKEHAPPLCGLESQENSLAQVNVISYMGNKIIGLRHEVQELKDGPSPMAIAVTYEYEYWVTLAHFQVRYPDLEIEDNLFATLPKDNNMSMDEVPFDASTDPPEV
ncbi:hypothetical protein BHM03_00020278 [Ensete ventricosum]|nr:hypothetical protein BHM03_00020278 [Ensete ventricosum]